MTMNLALNLSVILKHLQLFTKLGYENLTIYIMIGF